MCTPRFEESVADPAARHTVKMWCDGFAGTKSECGKCSYSLPELYSKTVGVKNPGVSVIDYGNFAKEIWSFLHDLFIPYNL